MAEEKNTEVKRRRRKKALTEEPVSVSEEAATLMDEPEQEPKAEAESTKPNPEVEALKEQNEWLKAQMEELKAQIVNMRPQVIQVSPDTERIEFLWLAPVADENELLIAGGLYGKITGKVGNFSVPKNELSRMLDAEMRKYIENRWLIVLGGLDDNERRMYGVDYKPGEVMDKEAFMRMLDIGPDIIGIYERLCDASKDVVAKMYYEAWTDQTKKKKVKRDTVVAMNKLAPKPGLKAIIEGMNQEDLGK